MIVIGTGVRVDQWNLMFYPDLEEFVAIWLAVIVLINFQMFLVCQLKLSPYTIDLIKTNIFELAT